MTPLLVSDLDGTLLNSAKAVTRRTVEVLNRFVADGGLFSIATARMAYGCDHLLAGIDLRLPGVVMNGAALYSFTERRYQEVQPIPQEATVAVAEAACRTGAGAFIYAVHEGRIRLGCAKRGDLEWTQYNSARARESVGEFTTLGFRNWDRLGETIYLALVGSNHQLARVRTELADTVALAAHPYRNVYTGQECLEYSSSGGGKAAAVGRLKELAGAERLIVFGDNQNDLAMMRLADLSFAPAGSTQDALAAADEVIESNDCDGVARTIEAHTTDWLPA